MLKVSPQTQMLKVSPQTQMLKVMFCFGVIIVSIF